MARKDKRWKGEFLVEVDQDGKVMLPVFDAEQPQPTHYRIDIPYGGKPGELRLVPMKVATEEDLRPEPEPVVVEAFQTDRATVSATDNYTATERAALAFACPFCDVRPGQHCVARPSGKLLINYEGTRNVHSKRLALVTLQPAEQQ